MNSPARHVIFGTGAIGLATLDALLRRGETVRMINRSGAAAVPPQVEVVAGNASDPAFTVDVTRVAMSSTRRSTHRTHAGSRTSRPCKQGLLPPPKPTARVLSAWRTSTCTAGRRAGR